MDPKYDQQPLDSQQEPQEEKTVEKSSDDLFYWLNALTTALVVLVLVFTFFGRLTRVDGNSMDYTLQNNELLLVWSLGYTPQQGDIVVLNKTTATHLDGVAIVINPANGVENLTVEQIAQIFTGEITNWSEVGGTDGEIAVFGREAGSGTRGAFEELLDVADQCAYAQELDSTGGVLAKVASTPGSIGYVSLDVVDDTVKALSLDGVEPTEENIVAGSYKLSRPFVMATLGTIDEQNDLVKTWFGFVQSDAGKAVITAMGLILPQ